MRRGLFLSGRCPCFFAVDALDTRTGKLRKRYPQDKIITPFDKLKSLPQADTFLKPGITFEQLEQTALEMSDNEAAQRLTDARAELFKIIYRRPQSAA